jgi:hypothetical protein
MEMGKENDTQVARFQRCNPFVKTGGSSTSYNSRPEVNQIGAASHNNCSSRTGTIRIRLWVTGTQQYDTSVGFMLCWRLCKNGRG